MHFFPAAESSLLATPVRPTPWRVTPRNLNSNLGQVGTKVEFTLGNPGVWGPTQHLGRSRVQNMHAKQIVALGLADAAQGMVAWLKARQAAVNDAKQNIKYAGVEVSADLAAQWLTRTCQDGACSNGKCPATGLQVYLYAETAFVQQGIQNTSSPVMINSVLPYVRLLAPAV